MEESIETIKSAVRSAVELLWPEEAVVFEMTLGQVQHWPRRWESTPATDWKALDLLEEVVDEGYSFPRNILEQVPPWVHFGVVIAGVAYYFQRTAKMPTRDQIETVYAQLGLSANLPSQVLDVGRSIVVELVQRGLRSQDSSQQLAVGYTVYEGRRVHSIYDEGKLEGFRRKKTEYDVYVDDPRSEVLVLGKSPTLQAGETNNFLLLKCLLRRVGGHWTHDELFKELKMTAEEGDEDHKAIIDSDPRVLLHRMLGVIRKSLSEKAGKTSVERWFDSSKVKRIVINADIKSCLIEAAS